MSLGRWNGGWLAGRNLTGTRRPLGVAGAGALLAVLVPKCPLCLAMYLSFLGAAASWVVWLRPLGVALTLAGLSLAAWRSLRSTGERKTRGEDPERDRRTLGASH